MLTKEKLLKEARKTATQLIVPDKRDKTKADKNKSLTSSQLRRFFGEIKRLEMKYKVLKEKGEQEAFNEISPMLALLVANANYTFSRGKIPEEFKNFLEAQIESINSGKEFEEFVRYFEAVVGYYYFEAKKSGLTLN